MSRDLEKWKQVEILVLVVAIHVTCGAVRLFLHQRHFVPNIIQMRKKLQRYLTRIIIIITFIIILNGKEFLD